MTVLGLIAAVALICGQALAQTAYSGSYVLPLDDEIIGYNSRPPADPAAELQQRIDKGEVRLDFEAKRGYLLSVLKSLGISTASQTLVFSKTSFQQHLISPSAPRALYFNDDVYVGWVQGGDVLEIASVDPAQGTMFYTLDQRAAPAPKIARRAECLQCHASPKTLGVPGLTLRSVFPDYTGFPQLQAGSFDVDHTTPMKQRWGGWYVTGTHGAQRHMGNVWVKDKDKPELLDVEAGANVTSLKDRFDTSPYPRPDSDIVALLVFEHQARLHSLLTRANWEVRVALVQQAAINRALGAPETEWSDSTRRRIQTAADALVRYMLFLDEAPLEAPVKGTSGFETEFPKAGPRDRSGRSLRDFDLKRRLFRYPCSFLIYSKAFEALPKPLLDEFYRRLWDALKTSPEGAAIREILAQTKSGLPEYWR